MKKTKIAILGIILALAMITVNAVSAVQNPTYVTGHVYRAGTYIGVPNIPIMTTCNNGIMYTATNFAGVYTTFHQTGCGIGDIAQACIISGTGIENCATGIVRAISPTIPYGIAYINLNKYPSGTHPMIID